MCCMHLTFPSLYSKFYHAQ
uniref:Uncharacterized protein n=1 Tax=Rhizophora mucronata TaxID=61149 RepID=A0A2P2QKN4_RHIMU